MAKNFCTLTYTIFDSEDCRAPLEDALEQFGWVKTGHGQQTHWTGRFEESLFITYEDRIAHWDHDKIRKIFLSYFSGVDRDTDVDVIFVLTVGNHGGRAIHVRGERPYLRASVDGL